MIHEGIDDRIRQRKEWALRRQLGIPNSRRLFVLTCMDERVPIEAALGIEPGDAHIYRNAGGLVTDDVIRSAMLTCNFFGTTEIIVVNHTECGMMTASGEEIYEGLSARLGIDPAIVPLDPAVPDFGALSRDQFARWVRTFTDVDQVCKAQVEFLLGHPLIPKGTTVSGYIYEVESNALRHPGSRVSEQVSTSEAMSKSGTNR